MKQTVTQSMFIHAFNHIRPHNFSYEALCALFDHFEQLEQDIGEEIELDVIAICCDFIEYTVEEIEREFPQILQQVDYDYSDNHDARSYQAHVALAECAEFDVIPVKHIYSMAEKEYTTFIISL